MPLRKINIIDAADCQISNVFDPYVVSEVNESQVKVVKFGEVFDWHSHAKEDEAFLVLRGRIAIDFRDGTAELSDRDFIVVPRTVEHRPRSLTEKPLVLMIEPSTTLNTGYAVSDHTVKGLRRQLPA